MSSKGRKRCTVDGCRRLAVDNGLCGPHLGIENRDPFDALRKCEAVNRNGTPCRQPTKDGATLCKAHSAKALAAKDARKALFLEHLAGESCGFRTHAAAAAGIPSSTLHQWLREDPDFALATDNVANVQTDEVGIALVRRAIGFDYPVHLKDGTLSHKKHEGSDQAALAILKSRRPGEFGDRQDLRVGMIREPDNEAAAAAIITDPEARRAVRDAAREQIERITLERMDTPEQ